MSTIQSYGWDQHFETHYQPYQEQALEPARIITIQGFKHTLVGPGGFAGAQLSGSFMNSREPEAYPRAGDWVVCKRYGNEAIILDVLPRINELSRKAPGTHSIRQVLAANIDGAFIVQGLDGNFNLMRLQRYVQQIIQCGIRPMIILNKTDLVPDPARVRQQVQELGYECPVILTSAVEPANPTAQIDPYLLPRQTYIFLGSSGVGKSTLLNNLLGYKLQEEGATSTVNNKGRHTTTTSNLVLLANGSMIIDAPGMREFGLTGDEEQEGIHHPQLEQLSAQCRFSDCSHQHEPGCAVIEAVENGNLPAIVYRSYLKLLREQQHFQASTAEKRRNDKQFGKIAKQVCKHRKDTKY